MAEGVGFEPTSESPRWRFSRPLPSTSRPPLRAGSVASATRPYYRPMETLILACADGRLRDALQRLEETLEVDVSDQLLVPGGPLVLVRPGMERRVALECIRSMVANVGVRRIVLVSHQDCRAYERALGGFGFDQLELLDARPGAGAPADRERVAGAHRRDLRDPLDAERTGWPASAHPACRLTPQLARTYDPSRCFLLLAAGPMSSLPISGRSASGTATLPSACW